MAMIQCEECGSLISEQAETCPNCGYPIQKLRNQEIYRQEQEQNRRFNEKAVIYNIIAFAVAYGMGYYLFLEYGGGSIADTPLWITIMFVVCVAIILLLCYRWIPWIFAIIFLQKHKHIPSWAIIIVFAIGFVIGSMAGMG